MKQTNKSTSKKINVFKAFKNPAFLLMLPATIIFLLLGLYPILTAIWESLHNLILTGLVPKDFIWFENYINLLFDGRFWSALLNSIIYVATSVTVSFLIGLAIALLLSKISKFQTLFQIGFLIPMVISPIVASYNFRFMYDYTFGIFNYLLNFVGINSINFLGDENLALWSTIVIDIWQWTPLVILILLAGIEALPRDPYEAAIVEGASKSRIFFNITLPMLKPFILITILLRLMDSLRVYEYIEMVTSGGPGSSSETLNIYLATVGFKSFEMGKASAIGIVLLFLISMLTLFLIKKTNMFNSNEKG